MEAPASTDLSTGYKSLDLKWIDVSVQIAGILPLTLIKHILWWAGNMSKQQRLQDGQKARKCWIGKSGAIEKVTNVFVNIWVLFVRRWSDGWWEFGRKKQESHWLFVSVFMASEAALNQTGAFCNFWSSNRITVKCIQMVKKKKSEWGLVCFSFKVRWDILLSTWYA